MGTSESSAGILCTSPVSHFQVKWSPKRDGEEKARYEGLMILGLFSVIAAF